MKNIFLKLKWVLSQSKSVVFFLISIITLGSISSIVNVYRAVVSKTLIDSATKGQKEIIIQWIIIFALIICIEIVFKTLISIISTYSSGKISNRSLPLSSWSNPASLPPYDKRTGKMPASSQKKKTGTGSLV